MQTPFDINQRWEAVFANPDPLAQPRLSRVLKWAVLDRLTGRRRRSPAKSVVPVTTCVDVPERDSPASVVWLGHATTLITVGGVRVLTDPVFSVRLGPGIRRNVPPPSFSTGCLPEVDVVVLSHNHHDHLDRGTIAEVERQGGPVYIVPLGLERYLARWGIEDVRIATVGWWETAAPLASRSDLSVTCVPAQHWSQRTPFDKNRTLWGGFVIEVGQRRIYFSGDSGYFGGFTEIGRRFPHIDLALLPIGAYDPEWFMQPQHMCPEQAGQAMLDVGAARMLAIHWGTYKLSDEPLDEPPKRLESWRVGRGLASDRVVVLPVGGSMDLVP